MQAKILFNIDSDLKTLAAKKAERDGLPLTTVLNVMLKAYANGELKIGIVRGKDGEAPKGLQAHLGNHVV